VDNVGDKGIQLFLVDYQVIKPSSHFSQTNYPQSAQFLDLAQVISKKKKRQKVEMSLEI